MRPFPQVSAGHWQASFGGGAKPVWGRNGRELFYLDLTNTLMSVPVQTFAGTVTFGNPARVFEKTYAVPDPNARPYDVSPDGQRFLMIKETAANDRSATAARIIVVLNWFEELKARVPIK